MYRKHYRFFANWMSPQELFNELYLYVLCTSNLQKNYVFLKTSLVNHTKYILQYRINRYKHQCGSVNEKIDYTKYGGETNKEELLATITENNIQTFQQEVDEDYEQDNIELLITLDTIKNKDVYNILVVAGYLMANISCLRPKYLQLLKTADRKVYDKLIKLQQRVEPEEEQNKRLRKINIKEVIKALQIDFNENKSKLSSSQKVNNTLEELKYYLQECNIF